MGKQLTRRAFIASVTISASASLVALSGCSQSENDGSGTEGGARGSSAPSTPLPSADPDPESPFGVDRNVNMATIDGYLNRTDVAYRDMRMVKDPADFESIGGSRNLDIMLPGFVAVGFPLIGTLQPLPVSGAYDGDRLFDITWNEDGTVAEATPRYTESLQIVEELFPKDKTVVLMCGGGGYAGMMRQLLVHLGWNPDAVYNAGGAWDYAGYESIQITNYSADGEPIFHMWRVNQVPLGFEYLTSVA